MRFFKHDARTKTLTKKKEIFTFFSKFIHSYIEQNNYVRTNKALKKKKKRKFSHNSYIHILNQTNLSYKLHFIFYLYCFNDELFTQ